jgi:xanthine dehydrogenase YagR molybdenum-binding subunit
VTPALHAPGATTREPMYLTTTRRDADVHAIETLFVEEEDTVVNPLGVKGMGELGMVGIPAAIANAVFHATGKRIRELPITPDKLL